jgi:lipid-binding SYLF domain-containing protein
MGPLATVARAASAEELTARGRSALARLYATDHRALDIRGRAKGILVFPSILKAGFIFGAETGNGVLLERGRAAGFYNLSGGSWGIQVGGEDFAFALFFMTDSSLHYLEESDGFSAGTGPSIVVVNKGAAAEADVTTLTHDVYAFPFSEKGLMADLTLQGTKITRIHPHH